MHGKNVKEPTDMISKIHLKTEGQLSQPQ